MSSEIELWCWVQGDELKRVFLAKIKQSDTITHLKEVIHAKKPSFKHIDPEALDLWKVREQYWYTLVHRSDSMLV